jgi:hypothetical protein
MGDRWGERPLSDPVSSYRRAIGYMFSRGLAKSGSRYTGGDDALSDDNR